MAGKIQYQMMVLLMEDFNESELKIWAFKYAKELQSLGASEISVISRGQRNLAYLIDDYTKANFIEINFIGANVSNPCCIFCILKHL